MKTNQDAVSKLHDHELYLYFYDDFLTEERTDRECVFIFQNCERKSEGKKLVYQFS